MSFPARVFRVLIASPSDVIAEREIAVRAIQEWNALNSFERNLVLLPVRWETHSAPDYGKRPQEVINRQLVDNCDMLIGIFWTRIGSQTGVSESGTIEEIERVAESGRPVMLYFSQVSQDPDEIDLEQLSKLREFKRKTYPNALIQKYSDHTEFKNILPHQIEIQLRSLLAAESEGGVQTSSISPVTDIILEFSEPDNGSRKGDSCALESKYIVVSDFENIPDYIAPIRRDDDKIVKTGVSLGVVFSDKTNKDYYRQVAMYKILGEFFRPVRFWLKNKGGVGARDVYIDIALKSDGTDVVVVDDYNLQLQAPTKAISAFGNSLLAGNDTGKLFNLIDEGGASWSMKLEVPALQPQRELSPVRKFFIGAKSEAKLSLSARIYADTLPEPLIVNLDIAINVKAQVITAVDFMQSFEGSPFQVVGE